LKFEGVYRIIKSDGNWKTDLKVLIQNEIG